MGLSFVPASELMAQAEAGNYAIGAFNINNMEIVQAIMAAAREEQSPVILQASQGAIKYAGIDYITALARVAVAEAGVPAALHLDHGPSFQQAMECIRSGFSSVMYDGSHLPLEENIAITRQVVEAAQTVGVSVEGEIGRLVGIEEHIQVSELEGALTDPQEAKRFAEETDIDMIAVAIGSRHGFYKGEPKLDFERLAAIRNLVDIPIVLHGGSGIPESHIRQAIDLGVRKINIDTELRDVFVRTAGKVMEENPDEIDPRKILGPAREQMKERVKEKMRLFGSSGRA